MTTGNRIRRLRKHEGLTLKQLAEKIGVTESAMCRYELGSRQLPLRQLRALVAIFEVSADYLLGRTETDSNDGQRGAA